MIVYMKYKCPKCEAIFEGELSRCPTCGHKMKYRPLEVKEDDSQTSEPAGPGMMDLPKEDPQAKKQRKRHESLALSIVAIAIAVAAAATYPLIFKSIGGLSDGLLSNLFDTILAGLWKAMVRELFTFIFFLIIAMCCVIGIMIFFLILVASGPFFSFIALILGIVAACVNKKKWHGWVALGVSLLAFALSLLFLYLFLAS